MSIKRHIVSVLMLLQDAFICLRPLLSIWRCVVKSSGLSQMA